MRAVRFRASGLIIFEQESAKSVFPMLGLCVLS